MSRLPSFFGTTADPRPFLLDCLFTQLKNEIKWLQTLEAESGDPERYEDGLIFLGENDEVKSIDDLKASAEDTAAIASSFDMYSDMDIEETKAEIEALRELIALVQTAISDGNADPVLTFLRQEIHAYREQITRIEQIIIPEPIKESMDEFHTPEQQRQLRCGNVELLELFLRMFEAYKKR